MLSLVNGFKIVMSKLEPKVYIGSEVIAFLEVRVLLPIFIFFLRINHEQLEVHIFWFFHKEERRTTYKINTGLIQKLNFRRCRIIFLVKSTNFHLTFSDRARYDYFKPFDDEYQFTLKYEKMGPVSQVLSQYWTRCQGFKITLLSTAAQACLLYSP